MADPDPRASLLPLAGEIVAASRCAADGLARAAHLAWGWMRVVYNAWAAVFVFSSAWEGFDTAPANGCPGNASSCISSGTCSLTFPAARSRLWPPLCGRSSSKGTRGRQDLVSRSGSSMRKSFAHCEAFGLTPFLSPWIPSAREGLSAGTGRPGRRHGRQWRRGPPLPALRCAQRGASVATGGSARGGSQGGGGPSAPRLLQNLTPPPARLPPGCSAPTKLDSQLALPWRTGWASGRRGARERDSNSAGVRYPRAEWILLCMYTCSMKCPICARAS